METENLYDKHDPEPPPPPPPAGAPELSTERRRGGRPPAQGPAPTPRAAAERERRARKKAENQEATKPAPQVSQEQTARPVAEQVVYTLTDLSAEQRRAREMMLGMLAFGWGSATSKVLGFPLARPAGEAGAAFDELVKQRPDVGAAAAAWEQWVTAFDIVAIKRGWYQELPAEWALAVSSVALLATVGMVWLENRKSDAQRQAEKAAERQKEETQAAEDARVDEEMREASADVAAALAASA